MTDLEDAWNGTPDATSVTTFVGMAPGGTWQTTEAVLSTDGGTWRGTFQGVADLKGVSPFAEGLVPYNYAEGHFVGEGPFAGLEYHSYLAGSNSRLGITGWIVSSP